MEEELKTNNFTVEVKDTPLEAKPEVQPGPSESQINIAGLNVMTKSDETQPGEKPLVVTPQVRSDMFHNKLFAALSYIPLGFLLVFAFKNESRFCIYHARQGMIVFFAQFIGSLFTAIPYVGTVIFGLTLFLSIIGIVAALRANDYFRFPFIGKLAEKMTFI